MKILLLIGAVCVVAIAVNHYLNNMRNLDFDEIFDDMKDI